MRNFASKDQPGERLGQKPTGLRGGVANKSIKPNKTATYLQLTNTQNDCFVNSVIQLVMATGYGTFLRKQLPQLLEGAHPQSFKLSRLLANLFCGQLKGPVSTSSIRRIVAQKSGKVYMDLGTQQDAEEFFRALEETLSEELKGSADFEATRDKHWGSEEIRRRFRDNTQHGKCLQCGQYPSIKQQDFITLRLNIPRSSSSVSLSSIIKGYYSESTQTDKMRCPNCCPHDRDRVKCTNAGICKSRESTEIIQLTRAPELLFIQLLRYDGNNCKVKTHIKIDAELVLPDRGIYEPMAMVNHIGPTQNSGHYVTHRRLDSGQWMLFNDTFNQISSLKEANTAENYILFFRRKDPKPTADLFPNVNEDINVENKVQVVFVSDPEVITIEDTLIQKITERSV